MSAPHDRPAAPVAADDELREAIADEVAQHGSTMSYGWDDRVRLGCTCGHDRGETTKRELSADLPGTVRTWRLHVADALLSGPLADVPARLSAAEQRAADAEAKLRRVEAWAAMNDDMAREYDEAAAAVTTIGLRHEAEEHAEDCRAIAEGVRRALAGEP